MLLDTLKEADLLDTVLYVDLCNEYPQRCWIPFLYEDKEYVSRVAEGIDRLGADMNRTHPVAVRWMEESIALLKNDYPDFLYTFSQVGEYERLKEHKVDSLDVLEPHIWMCAYSDYYEKLDYNYERFDPKDFVKVALYGEKLYRDAAAYWDQKLIEGIRLVAEWSETIQKPLVTTECWGLVDYKDGPMMHWDWIKHLCELGTRTAAQTGRWMAIATSNFCGPQFVGMWRDTAWHKRLTDCIKNASLPR